MKFYSKLNNAILFAFKKQKREKSSKIFRISSKYARIIGRGFLKQFNLHLNKYIGSYKAELESIPSIGQYWVIYLDKKIEEKNILSLKGRG